MDSELTRLRDFIAEYYTLEDLRTLCFDLGIQFDELGGEGISAKARELIIYLGKQHRYLDLLIYLEKTRQIAFKKGQFNTSLPYVDDLYKSRAFKNEDQPSRASANKSSRAKLKIQRPDKDYIIFIIAGAQVTFGMGKRRQVPEIDITLRVLPSRSHQQDPDNWAKSAMISKIHGCIRVSMGGVQLIDKSKNGIYVRSAFQSDHAFYESLGKWAAIYGTLDEGRFNISSDFVRIPSNTWVSLPEKCEVSLGRNILHLGITTHTGERAGKIDAVHLTRLSNFREHEYMYLVERITIGGDRRSIIQLRGLDNLNTVAEIEFTYDTFLIKCLQNGLVNIDDINLAEGEMAELVEGTKITIGTNVIFFETVQDEDFTPD